LPVDYYLITFTLPAQPPCVRIDVASS